MIRALLVESVWGVWAIATAVEAGVLGLVILAAVALLRPSPAWTAVLALVGLLQFLVPPPLWLVELRSTVVIGLTGDVGTAWTNPLLALAAATHGVGLLVGLALLTRSAWTLRQDIRRGQEVTEGPLHESLRRAAGRHEIRTPRLILCDGTAPAAAGIFRPAVLLPPDIGRRLDPGDLELVLAHEVAHIARRDPLTAACRTLVVATWFAHPVAWLLARLHRAAAEDACDDTALARCRRPAHDYCRAILQAAALHHRGRSELAPAADTHPLGRRFRRLLEANRGHVPGRGWVIALLVAAALAALPIRLVRFERDPEGRNNVVTILRNAPVSRPGPGRME